MDFSYPGSNDFRCLLFGNILIPLQNGFSCLGMDQLAGGQPTDNSLSKRGQQLSFLRLSYPLSVYSAAVLLKGDNIMGGIDKTSGEITAF